MKRLTTAYEWIFVDGSVKMQYVVNASDLEVASRLGTYEDAEEEGRLFVVPCKPGDLIYEVDVIERPEWDCYVNGFVVQDVSAKQVKYYELGIGLKDNSAYRRTARKNRVMNRVMKRK